MIIDSGASKYISASISPFHLVSVVEEVENELVSGSTVKSSHKGKLVIDTEIMTLMLRAVYFISRLQLNLLFCFGPEEYRITTITSRKLATWSTGSKKRTLRFFFECKVMAFTLSKYEDPRRWMV